MFCVSYVLGIGSKFANYNISFLFIFSDSNPQVSDFFPQKLNQSECDSILEKKLRILT